MAVIGTFFAIRKKGTNLYLTEHDGKGRKVSKGFTMNEPMQVSLIPPRLFTMKRSAKMALSKWLMGKHEVSYNSFGETCRIVIKGQADRKAEDMEIVSVTLLEIPSINTTALAWVISKC